ncbi:MAG: ribonucleoside-diphosphate reductase subunit alpha [Peptoniphilus harei]|uniref:Ribonucleoside-diphosphate reductase n=1 Tax=Peptoniphilus harei ACS-146-V-Sch2b TaxID=908338 RepID=E4KWW3_9FIRM|nr:ribonucleoside-diphosphate reductase subunit alpha [Peptoniphilus harei]EFR33760.1 ribonucleoside-diphosphate reductase, alpha subunit [Peptoniphilus harei ACS-146-V-Sch2b]MDK7754674.1 ribonucleoside-diphosphate reductase subunit alpha [Peptoniphilus harei]MDK7760480.1 ribonucleoside-diphosphate reductase subunit alpha [Peptoniphilus harei]MDK8270271.1 ribonucleoside-diphosphate reductase subunit alpha [Peptoniphilus harei]MDK8338730.1 ribonucleoside-diphosphate reductase subunit alpha [Pep
MKILKRDKREVDFDHLKIKNAIEKAFDSVGKSYVDSVINAYALDIKETLLKNYDPKNPPTVEEIQDLVELKLIDEKEIEVVKAYILYRNRHSEERQILDKFANYITDDKVLKILKFVRKTYDPKKYELENLYKKFESFVKKDQSQDAYLSEIIKAASELTDKDAPRWEFIAALFLNYDLEKKIKANLEEFKINNFYEKIVFLTEKGLYGKYILENYSKEDILELEDYIDNSRNRLLNYSGLDLLIKRYVIRSHDGRFVESIQEMFMGIAMHLAIPEKNRIYWAKKFYDIYSSLKVTVATPTMSNARKPYNQLSSCFIDTVPDTLKGIYRSIDNFAQISKHGGGMGLYFGKVRATGSDIRGFKGVAGGVIRWIKLANDTAVAVDQLGVRQGSVACYLDAWHKDIPEFLQLRTNNGDDRMKAHDIFPAISYPNLFFELAEKDINATWYMFDPHEVLAKKGYSLEDFYGKEWEEKYRECIEDESISRREMSVKDLVRLIIKSLTETGTPFAFYRDNVNEMNPNKHVGMIYSSNLCTEIMQNMSAIETLDTTIETEDGDEVIVTKTKPGDFVVCNLASLVLGNIDLEDDKELKDIVATTVRALDNVIDLNYYPIPYAKVTNRKYRSIGLGTSGYHHALVKAGMAFSDIEDHLKWADDLYERINFHAVTASMEIAKEKGSYDFFEGSDWENGNYFDLRDYKDAKWNKLREEVKANGLRNGYIMAIAPTGSTSIIAATSAGVDPIMNRYFLEEKKGSILPRVAPDLTPQSFWLYENAHELDQNFVIEAAAIRQRHIDQAQSINFYITTDFTMRKILNLYIKAAKEKLKSVYYVRSKSLEVEDCDYCAS